jgi:integrase/recombinase XerD
MGHHESDVRVPLPPSALTALDAIPTAGEYCFWSGDSPKKACVGIISERSRSLLARVESGHAHRWRDTFAGELLLSGIPLEQVSLPLGH